MRANRLSIVLAVAAAGAASAAEPIGRSFSLPVPDAERGRQLFVQKACVVCHSVNGVGGTIGPALDASEPTPPLLSSTRGGGARPPRGHRAWKAMRRDGRDSRAVGDAPSGPADPH